MYNSSNQTESEVVVVDVEMYRRTLRKSEYQESEKCTLYT